MEMTEVDDDSDSSSLQSNRNSGGSASSASASDSDQVSSSGVVRLMPILFPFLNDEEKAIQEMERHIIPRRPEFDANAEEEEDDTNEGIDVLLNATVTDKTSLSLIKPSADVHQWCISVVAVHLWYRQINVSADRNPSAFIPEKYSTITWAIQPAYNYFFAEQWVESHYRQSLSFIDAHGYDYENIHSPFVIPSKWQSRNKWELNEEVDVLVGSTDHMWIVMGCRKISLISDGLDSSIHLRILNLFSNSSFLFDPSLPQPLETVIDLPSSEPITAITILSKSNSSQLSFLYSRKHDFHAFRSVDINVSRGGSSPHLVVSNHSKGPFSNRLSGSAVRTLQVLNYNVSDTAYEDAVVVVQNGDDSAPFFTSIYRLDTPSLDLNHMKELQEFSAVVDVEIEPTIRLTEPHIMKITDRNNASDFRSLSDLGNRTWVQKSSWRTYPNLYQKFNSMHPPPLISSSSHNHRFVIFSSLPFVSTIDELGHYDPLEIIHLGTDTVFATISVTDSGSMISLSDQKQDFIILEKVNVSSADPSHGQRKSQWHVSMEVHLPSSLSKLNILQAIFTDVPIPNDNSNSRTAPSRRSDASLHDPDVLLSEEWHTPSLASQATVKPPCTYLITLLESGVISTLCLCTSLHDHVEIVEATGTYDTEDELMAQIVRMNWEFLLGFFVMSVAALISLRPDGSTIFRQFAHWPQPRRLPAPTGNF
jgi:hypothetical protein